MRVVIVEDQALLREGIVALLREQGIDVVAQAEDGPGAFGHAQPCSHSLSLLRCKAGALPEVVDAVKAQLFRHLKNPQDCVWSRLLTPKDLQQLFLFPAGNIDHTELVGGQTFADRQFSADPARRFYQFGPWSNLAYCGAGAYPCGSIAGTPGYMCAQQLVRLLTAKAA